MQTDARVRARRAAAGCRRVAILAIAVAFGPSCPCFVSKMSRVTCRDAAPANRHPRDCRRFWTLVSSSCVKSVKSYRDQGVLVAKRRTVVTWRKWVQEDVRHTLTWRRSSEEVLKRGQDRGPREHVVRRGLKKKVIRVGERDLLSSFLNVSLLGSCVSGRAKALGGARLLSCLVRALPSPKLAWKPERVFCRG